MIKYYYLNRVYQFYQEYYHLFYRCAIILLIIFVQYFPVVFPELGFYSHWALSSIFGVFHRCPCTQLLHWALIYLSNNLIFCVFIFFCNYYLHLWFIFRILFILSYLSFFKNKSEKHGNFFLNEPKKNFNHNVGKFVLRAQKRMNKERVFNSQIIVSLPFAVKEDSSTSFMSINKISN